MRRTYWFRFYYFSLTLAVSVLLLWPNAARGSTFVPDASSRIAKLRQQYRALYQSPVVQHSDGSKTFGRAKLVMREGVRLVWIEGDEFEMAYQHARLLKDDILKGAIVPTARYVDSMLAGATEGAPLKRAIAERMARNGALSMFQSAKRLNPSEADVQTAIAIGLSEATGIAIDTIFKALLAPATVQYIAGRTLKTSTEVVGPVVGNCSSFAAWGGDTQTGEILIGRNTDYGLNGSFDRYPTVLYLNPTNGQPYMAVTSAGLQTLGLASYNASGIFVGVHTIVSKSVGANHVPAFFTAGQVIKKARNFQEALALFGTQGSNAAYAYILVSTKEKKAAVVELHNGGVQVRYPQGGADHLAQTNHFLSKAGFMTNFFINRGVTEDNDGRWIRLKEQLRSLKGIMAVQDIPPILADHVDPKTRSLRALGNTIGTHVTMTSVALAPERGKAFMAKSSAPVSHGAYVEIPLVQQNVSKESLFGQSYSVLGDVSLRATHPQKFAALLKFVEAKTAYQDNQDFAAAAHLLLQAATMDPSEAGYWFQLGIVSLKTSNWHQAYRAFKQVLAMPQISMPLHLSQLNRYYLGRLYAVLGYRQDATAMLYQIEREQGVDPKLLRAVQRDRLSIQRRLRRHSIVSADLPLLMQQTDLVSY